MNNVRCENKPGVTLSGLYCIVKITLQNRMCWHCNDQVATFVIQIVQRYNLKNRSKGPVLIGLEEIVHRQV